jgi:hypothetical protein
MSSPGNVHLVVAVRRPRAGYLRAAAWTALPMMAVHALAVVAAFALGGVKSPEIGWPAIAAALAVHMLVIVWFTALGSVIGRFSPPLLSGLIAAVASLVLVYYSGGAGLADRFRLLDLGAATVSRLGLGYDAGYLAGQTAVLAVTALLVLATRVRLSGLRAVPTRSGLAGVAVALVLVVTSTVTFSAVRVTARPSAPTQCQGTDPVVCLFAEHDRFAPSVRSGVDRLAEPALRAGYASLVPSRIEERSRTYVPQGAGVKSFNASPEMYKTRQIGLEELAVMLVEPAQCPALSAPVAPPDEYYNRLYSVVFTWLGLAGQAPREGLPFAVERLTPLQVEQITRDFAQCRLTG